MDRDLQNATDALLRNQNQFEAIISELARMFPHDSNIFAWKDKIFTEQRKYRSGASDVKDYQPQIAWRWLQMAREGRLKVALDNRGFSVVELDIEALNPVELEKVIFISLKDLSAHWLLYPDLYAAVSRLLGLSLSQHLRVLNRVLNDLDAKGYIRCDQSRDRMVRITRGLNFDEWKSVMTKPNSPSVTHNTFTFNDQVGAVQTGTGSVANVQQAAGAAPYADLKAALQLLLQELPTSSLEQSKRQGTAEIIDRTIQEIDSKKPSEGVLTALCSGLATTVQTLGSASAAYQAAATAFAAIGISLP